MKTSGVICQAALILGLAGAMVAAAAEPRASAVTNTTNVSAWLSRPLSMEDAIHLALRQNGTILKGKADLEAAYGVVVQTRAIAIPKVRGTSGYAFDDAVERFPFAAPGLPPDAINPGANRWNGNIRVEQTIYEGGRIRSALRTAKLTKEQALLQYQAVVADTLLEVRVAYYEILLAAQLIVVQEASLALLQKELEDTTRRFDAGTVPRFNVLRAEVEIANAKPKLIRAKNAHRIAKNNLANLLGFRVPAEVWEDVPITLTEQLEIGPYEVDLPSALGQALERRPELGALQKAERLRKESLTTAKSGRKPTIALFGGYGARNSSFGDDFFNEVSGWTAGVQLNWELFDGFLTKGKVQQATALYERARADLDDTTRRIELEVRTAYSNFLEAKEVLESQKKVQEQAEEALRLATVRSDAGTGTQLDVLNAQTALTEARATRIQALHDYAVARARLERATGQNTPQPAATR
ncbi:MAG: TolC family protein [Verrucomicrobia bacterium]|nr:TolC family protein [Verrucomicrobiota bacterium]